MDESLRLAYLRAMEIECYLPRRVTPEAELSVGLPLVDEQDAVPFELLKAAVRGCTRCALSETRTQTVFGVGHEASDWMFVGEAPGEQEDLRGQPFVGRAGQLLDEMITSLGLRREDVYIANVLKCRPPKNRDPLPAESESCEPFLRQQLALVRPRVIVALGRISAQLLLKTQTPIGKLRGTVHYYESVPLIVTYHPAYLLRAQSEKRRAWEDLRLALSVMVPEG